jgi:hypothetical protein
MVNRLQRFTTGTVDALDLIAHVAIVVLLSEIRRRTVGGTTRLGTQLEALMLRPSMRQLAHFQVEMAQLLVNLQVLDAKDVHVHLRPLTSDL